MVVHLVSVPQVSSKKTNLLALGLLLVLISVNALATWHFNPQLSFSMSPPIGGGDGAQFSPSNVTTPVTGVVSLAMLLVDFADRNFTRTIPDVNRLFLERLENYYDNVSYGSLKVEGKVFGVFHLAKTMSSYGSDVGTVDGDMVNGLRTYHIVEDALAIADSTVDFSNYRYLVIVHAGEGQESDPKITNNIWSIAYLGGVWFKTSEKNFDRAAIVPERENQGADVLGVTCHEFAHLLGLPDLYNSHNSNHGDAGRWDLMARGLWNGNPPGSEPAHPTAWSKIKLGWIQPDQVRLMTDQSLTDYLGAIEQNRRNLKAVKVPLFNGMYYLVEYRSRTLDPALPSDGVLLTKVDLNSGAFQGVLTVVSNRGGTSDATLRLGDLYLNKQDDLLAAVRFSNGTSYGIDLVRGDYREVKIRMPLPNSMVLVDGKPCTTPHDGVISIFLTPENHTLSVPETIAANSSLRAVFQGWADGVTGSERTIQTTTNTSLSVLFKEQALLSIQTSGLPDPLHGGSVEINGENHTIQDFSPVESWIDMNKTVHIDLRTNIVNINESARYVFGEWSESGSNSTSITVRVFAPTEVVAKFKLQYFLKIKSGFGSPIGEGWYDNGSLVEVQVASPYYIDGSERLLFVSWSGLGSNARAVVLMNKPYSLAAQWKRQYLTDVVVSGSDGKPLQGEGLVLSFESPNGSEIVGPLGRSVWLDEGFWVVRMVTWHGVDVTPMDKVFKPSEGNSWVIRPRVYTLTTRVSTQLLRRGVQDATVSLQLPNGLICAQRTNQTGYATFTNLPTWEYNVNVARNGDVVAASGFYVTDNVLMEVRVSDSFENGLAAVSMVLGVACLGMTIVPTLLSKGRHKRRRSVAFRPELEYRVYRYILNHGGVISKATAADELGVSKDTLIDVVRHLKKIRRSKNLH
jgi:M6 family metalloprotease-like protein